MSSLPFVPLASEEPLYNIGVVTRMTEISMASLRAWERRYGFPESSRTSGGHRLYSEMDIVRIKWVKDRIDEGMGTSQAIIALRHQEKDGRISTEITQLIPVEQYSAGESFLAIYRERLLNALLQCDLVKANDILSEAVVVTSPEMLVFSMISPVMAEVGNLWEYNQINTATEHLATNFLRQRMLLWMLSSPPPRKVSPIIVACAPDEYHEGSILILGTLLRRRQWPVVYLGQAVPLADLAVLVNEIKPKLVILVAMTENTANNICEWPRWISQDKMTQEPIVGFGGRIFTIDSSWQTRIPGVYLGNTFQDGINKIEQLMH
jgi:DNA-binding transcriptional MerR regulator